MLAGGLGLPVLATFEHPVDEKGALPARLERVFPVHGQRLSKHAFDCCREPAIRNTIKKTAIKQLAVAGAETDVCVLQSVIGLLKMGLEIFLLEDCVFTSGPDPRPALERMYRSGAVPCTFKTLYYELMAGVGEVSQIDRKRLLPSDFMWPEALPPRCPKPATEER